SATNFDFAGVNAATGKIELGSYNGKSWTVNASASAGITAGNTYNVFLAINGNYASFTLNGAKTTTSINFTYPWNVVGGANLGLSYGAVGTGTNNSTATFDNVITQVPIAPTTLTYNESFTGGTAKYLDAPAAGKWTMSSGFYSGTAPSGGFALSDIDLGLAIGKAPGTFQLQDSSNLDIQAVLKQINVRGGLA